MAQTNQKKNWRAWRFSLICLSILLITSGTTFAEIPEPETLIYGQVYNLYQNNKIIVTDAQVECSIRKKGSNTISTYQAFVECMKCQEYDRDGKNCTACEKYAYLLKIPQETHPIKEDISKQIIPLLSDKQQYDFVDVKVNGVQANLHVKSEYGDIQSQDKQGKFILAGQTRRSHFYEIDLELVLPVSDSDKDGLPDFWEKQYGLNINDPEDASTDLDNDGWTNLNEFLYATNPIISNTVPVLLDSNILSFEGSKSLLQLNIADSDTAKENLTVKFVSIPSSIRLIFYGDNSPYKHGHIIQKNDIITWKHLENGNIILENMVTETITQRLIVELIDGDHNPVMATVTINTFKPTASDATDAILWIDAFYHTQTEGDTPSKRIQDRSGNDNRGNYYYSEAGEFYTEDDIQLVGNEVPSGYPVIEMNGYIELPYATPVFPENNVTLISVFKVNPSENDQIIASGPYFEVAVSGDQNRLHPGQLKVADESTAVYSNKRIDDNWVLATVTRKENHSYIDINSIWSGGPFEYNEITELANDPTMGGKNIWKWDFTNMKWMANVSGIMHGLFAEMLVFDRPLPYLEKWRIYAHLYGKWFGYVISDHSQATRDMRIVTNSGQKSEEIRLLKMEADLAWLAYSEAVFTNENIEQALTKLEAFLPANWQWSVTPPSVDEALNATDSIQYNYQKDFVFPYGNDQSYILIGGMGNDTLIGGFENDILIGGAGSDTLKGCSGKDIFVVTDGDDVIDFNVSDDDMIDISHLLHHTDKTLNSYIHFELVSDPETSEVHTMLKIDADGSGDQYNDAAILLRNVTLRDRIDIAGLWASGNILAGGSKPELEVTLTVIDDQATEIPENNASFEISFSNPALPKDLTIPLSLNGSAKIGIDYLFKIPLWDEKSNSYKTISANNIIPIKLKAGDLKVLVQVIPIADHIVENLETISISLLEKDDYYQLKRKDASIIEISDGLDEISIQTDQPMAIEGKTLGGSIIISRNGSLDISKDVSLLVKGTAENGRDVYYIPSEISFKPGTTKAVIPVVAYRDKESEDEEFVEVILETGDYIIKGPSSARVSVRDNPDTTINFGDINLSQNIDLVDAIIALQICIGKKPASVYAEASIKNGTIGIEEVFFILKQIAK